MKSTIVLLCFGALCSANVAASKGHPIEKVINLLKGLKAKASMEGKAEAVDYNKFVHWCSSSLTALNDAITDEKEQISELEDLLAGKTKEKETLETDIGTLEDEIGEMEAAALDSQTAHSLCSCIGQRFSTGFGHLLASGLPVPAKKFRKFGATLAEIVAGMPRTMMEGAMSCYTGKALLSALYCVYSPEFSDAMLPAAQDAQGAESNLISSLNAVQPKGSAPPSRAELSAEQVTELQGRYQLLVEIEQQEQPPTMNITSMWPAVSQLVYQSNQLLGSIQHMGDMMQSVELAVGDSEAFDRGSCMRLVVLKNAGLLVAVVVPEGQVAEISGFLRQHVMEQLETAFDFIHANKLDPSKSPVKDGRVRK